MFKSTPMSTLQDRIRQFEAMNGGGARPLQAKLPTRDRPRPNYPPIPRVQTPSEKSSAPRPSADLLSGPVSPTASSFTTIQPTLPYVPRKSRRKSPSPSPPNLGCKSSLIDLQDSAFIERAEWLKVSRPPPLPPRISSQNSGASSSSISSTSHASTPVMQARNSSNSLTVEHTYPPLNKSASQSNLRQRVGHASASSTSSFHSVSLSSDGDAAAESAKADAGNSVSNFVAAYSKDRSNSSGDDTERDRNSVDDSFSFETVSSTDIGSPTVSLTHEWEKDFSIHKSKLEPPKHPSRRTPNASTSPNSTGTSSHTSPSFPSSQKVSPPTSALRRIPPPPPSRFSKPSPPSSSSRASVMSTTTTASDRSSIFSMGTVTTAHTSVASCTQLIRPTPIPLIARKRYEAVFFANVNAQRRNKMKRLSPSTAASASTSNPSSPPMTPRKGWRGVSVDLVTNPEENPLLATPDDDVENSRLDGQVVKTIWSCSKLSHEKLRDIWNECAVPGQTSLDKDCFAKGMWRIDEELRRLQTMRSSTMTIARNSRTYVSKRTTAGPLLH